MPRGELPLDRATRGLSVRRLVIAPGDVVFVKGLLEASEGLASLFAASEAPASEHERTVVIAAPPDRSEDLDAFVSDVARETGARVLA
jgi:hypothetical protein